MRKNLERQPNINIYNAYKAGLFGHQHSDAEAEKMGLELKSYHDAQRGFVEFCSIIGGRVLYAMHEGSALVTPWPVDRKLVDYMAKIWSISPETLTMVGFDHGNIVEDLPAMILDDTEKMDQLRTWVNVQNGLPVVVPRTTTAETVEIAKELGVAHIPKIPNIPAFHGRQIIRGLYPTSGYIESHPAELNNSKVDNFVLLQQLDAQMGTEFSPKGGVAESIEEVVALIDQLINQGCQVLIKADLAVDGLGNIKVEKFNGRNFIDLSHLEKVDYVTKILSGVVPVGRKARVVVSEFLDTKIYDPSVEVFSPPLEWGLEPQIYYDCGMIIKGGFQGSIVGDPVDAADMADIPMLGKHNIPGVLVEKKSEYRRLMVRAKEMVMAFSKVKWGEGYVGISDCDLAICLGKDGKLSVKILEFNFNRETGGTAPYHIGQRLSQDLSQPGYVVARDAIGKGHWSDFGKIQRWAEDNNIDYLKHREGLLVLGSRPDGGMMSLVFSPTLKGALHWDLLLKELTS